MILAIDPGSSESGFVLLGKDLEVIDLGKVKNEELISKIIRYFEDCKDLDYKINCAIEMIASYGMSVGQTVFETCIWVGRFTEICNSYGVEVKYIYRKDEKINLCNSMKAKDSNIIQALIDRFAPTTPNKGKGSKKVPGWFYGFKKDIWQAYAVGVTYYDLYIKGEK